MKSWVLCFLLGAFTPSLIFSQGRTPRGTVSGTVVDADDKMPVMQATVQVLSPEDSTMMIGNIADLDGKATTYTLSSTDAALAESYGATGTGVDDLAQTIELLRVGRVDATLNAEVTYYDYMKQHPDAPIKIAALTEDASEVAIPVRKGEDSASFLAAVNEAIESMRESGRLTEISEKNLGFDISSEN